MDRHARCALPRIFRVQAAAEKQRDDAEKSAFGTFASKGGTEFTYREKKAGV